MSTLTSEAALRARHLQTEINAHCQQYFRAQKTGPYANTDWWTKFVLLSLAAVAAYVLVLTLPSALFGVHVAAMLVFNLLCLSLAFNVAHDASHRALFRDPQLNGLFSKVFDLVGISGYVWTLRHVRSHHKFTNVPEMDADLSKQSVIRLSPTTRLRPVHRFQVFYAILIYAHYTLILVFVKDLVVLSSRNMGSEKNLRHPWREVVIAVLGKVFYVSYALLIPWVVKDVPWGWTLGAFYLAHLVSSIAAFLVLFPAHFQDGTTFVEVDSDARVKVNWVAHQLSCTTDFAARSASLTWLTGGLNLHLVYHLFPAVCHMHYPKLARIIEHASEKHGFKYQHYSWGAAIVSHWRFLYRMGREAAPYCSQGIGAGW